MSGKMLCFGFKRKTLLITHSCFSFCWAVLHRAKDTSVSQLLALSCQWVAAGHKEVGECRTRTPQLNWTNEYSRPYDSMYKKLENDGELVRRPAAAWGLAGHWSVGGEQLHCASLVLYILLLLLLVSLPFLSCKTLNLWVFSPILSIVGRVSKWLHGA